MATVTSKVVSFESHQARHRDTARLGSDSPLIQECKNIASEQLNLLLQAYFAKVDDELFKLSDKAENNRLQSDFFEAMRFVRRERDQLHGSYMQSFLEHYDDFWRGKPHQFCAGKNEAQSLEEDKFALVENESLEEELAINTMIEKGNNLFRQELFALNTRFSFLLQGLETKLENSPVGPAAACRSFAEALHPRSLEFNVKILLYKLFDGVVLSALGPLYHQLNVHLIEAGVLPVIARGVKRSLGEAGERSERAGLMGEDNGDNASYMEAFQTMQSLLDGWRNRAGLPSFATSMPGGGPYFDSLEVINALSLLQHPSVVQYGKDAGLAGEGLKLNVTSQLGTLQPDGQNRPLGRLEEDTIDMVAMIFDFILEDRNLPDPVKALIARLQIPVVKVAILEKSFFAKKTHPARVLLNSLAQAGIVLDSADSDNPTFRKIEEVVGRILREFDQDVGLFASLLDDFSAFMEKESQRSRMVEERTRQTTQSKEQIALAKKKVAYEIASRLNGNAIPAAIRSFLYNAWKDVLILAHLRQDKDAADWEKAIAVMDKLLWTISSVTIADARLEIARTLPKLLQDIGEGLESISFDPHQTSTLLKQIKECHLALLRLSPEAAMAFTPSEETEAGKVQIKDAELADAIRQVKANLPDIMEIRQEDIDGASAQGAESAMQEADDDEFFQQASNLGIGEWLEFTEASEQALRAKLSWKSQVTLLYVFVNRKGVKVTEIKLHELADRLRKGAARVIEGATLPLMDRAISALMHSLNQPATQPANSPS